MAVAAVAVAGSFSTPAILSSLGTTTAFILGKAAQLQVVMQAMEGMAKTRSLIRLLQLVEAVV